MQTSRLPRLLPFALPVFAGLWVAGLFLAPYAVTHAASSQHPAFRLAAAAYLAGSLICHQRPARSFHLWGVQLPVCARCTGLYLLVPVGALLALAVRSRNVASEDPTGTSRQWRLLLALAVIPTAATVLLEWTGLGAMTNIGRALAALPVGAAVGWVIESAVARLYPDRAAAKEKITEDHDSERASGSGPACVPAAPQPRRTARLQATVV